MDNVSFIRYDIDHDVVLHISDLKLVLFLSFAVVLYGAIKDMLKSPPGVEIHKVEVTN